MPYTAAISDFSRFLDQLQALPDFVFLGSTSPGASTGRFSIASALAERHWLVRAGAENDRHRQNWRPGGPEPLKPGIATSAAEPSGRPFRSGLIGMLFYEAGYSLLPHLEPRPITAGTPLYWVGDFAWSAVFDHQTGLSHLYIEDRCSEKTASRVRDLLEQQSGPASQTLNQTLNQTFQLKSRFEADTSERDYCKKVERIRAYLSAGDCYQVNLSQRFQAGFSGSTWGVFRNLCQIQPSPYAAYLKTPVGEIISLSPEQFLGVRGRDIVTRPIKGTRPRGNTREEDAALSRALKSSEKDQAENLMIVDLLRNDLGRFCVPGTVEVTELFGLESYSNVHHLVSTIRGKLAGDVTPWEVLTGCFPGGSITGAPKIRAMQIIRELEAHWRGPYCGSVFYIGDDGQMDSSIAIRTLQARDNRLYCWGGGGVVMDSDPQAEYEESLVKVQRLMRQIESLGSV